MSDAAHPQNGISQGIDERINDLFEPISDISSGIIFYKIPLMEGLAVPAILIWMVAISLFMTFYLNFVNFRFFKHAINILRGKHDKDDDSDGQINRFQALATSLSGTVGLGNIGGVALAVSLGGPGAVFWMVVMGFIAMSTKFCEVMLGVKYRHHRDQEHPGKISGGPMYYLRDAFGNRNIPYLGPFLAGLFAVCCIGGSIGGGNMFQANQAFSQLVNVTGGEGGSFLADKGWAFGLVLALLTGVVIIGGIKSIANVASRIVPFMGLIYILCALVIISVNYYNIPDALLSILVGAFAPDAIAGGFFGAMLVGIQRATFSNEAGVGTAAIAHSATKTKDPVTQGFVGMLGPFIDTVVICTITALVIVISGAHLEPDKAIEGVDMTSRAFETGASWFPVILAVTVLLFAYSTIITWSYYGVKSATFLFGENVYAEYGYKLIFLACIVVGSSANLEQVIGFTDAMIFAMAIPNVIGLYLLAPEIKRHLIQYTRSLNTTSR